MKLYLISICAAVGALVVGMAAYFAFGQSELAGFLGIVFGGALAVLGLYYFTGRCGRRRPVSRVAHPAPRPNRAARRATATSRGSRKR